MPEYCDPSSSATTSNPPHANSQSTLSRDTSVISTSSSSSSLLNAPTPIRTHTAPESSSSIDGSPSRVSRPPAWLSRHFGRGPAEPSGEHTPVIKPIPSPTPSDSTRPRMTSSDDFEFGEELGGGSWSTVVEAVYPPTSKRYAIKILNKAQLVKEKMTRYAVVEKNALALLSSGDHPGIVRLYSAFHDSTSLYLVLSLAPNGDLRELVKKVGSLSLSCARYYTAQIVDTVHWIHSKGVLHRDLKPENILLDSEMRIKLTDFGSAYISKDLDLSPRSSTFVGTAAYVSPELLSGAVKTTSQSSDIWAIGCILYFLMVGKSPFLALNDYLSFKKIEALDYTFPAGFDSDARDLVQRLLVIDPSERLGVPPKSSPSELREHPFFTGHTLSGSGDHPTTRINWDTLWTDPPAAIESGLVQAPSREPRESDANQFSWDGFIHEFSLITNTDPSSDSPSGSEGQESTEEVSADPLIVSTDNMINGQRHSSLPPSITPTFQGAPPSPSDFQSSPSNTHTPISNRGSGSYPPAEDNQLMSIIDSWSSILISSETVRLVTEVETRSRHRLIHKTQHRQLALTTLPRIICAKVMNSQSPSSPSPLVVKEEFVFPASSATADHRPRNEIANVSIRGEHTFVLETREKCYVYTTHNQAETNLWVKEIQILVTSPHNITD